MFAWGVILGRRQNSNLVIYDVDIYLERIIAQLVKISPEFLLKSAFPFGSWMQNFVLKNRFIGKLESFTINLATGWSRAWGILCLKYCQMSEGVHAWGKLGLPGYIELHVFWRASFDEYDPQQQLCFKSLFFVRTVVTSTWWGQNICDLQSSCRTIQPPTLFLKWNTMHCNGLFKIFSMSIFN